MSTSPASPASPAVQAASVPDVGEDPARLGRLGPVLGAANLSWLLSFGVSSTLVQALLGQVDAHTKLDRYATMATVGALVGMVSNIAFGVLSDRTRSRFGRRNPWILAGGFGTAASLSALSWTTSFPVMLLLWMCAQVSLNAMVGPLTAILPDRVARADLGRASSWIGLGLLLGQSLGAVLAGLLLTVPVQGLRWIPWLVAAGALLVFRAAPDRSNAAETRVTLPLRESVRSLLPPRDPDFLWALVGRLLTMLGLQCVLVYQLYVLTDYLGLSTGHAGSVIALSGGITALTAGSAIAVSGPLSDRLGRRKPFVITAAALCAAAMVPLVLTRSLPAFFVFVLMAGFAYGAYVAVDQVIMAEVLPDQLHRAKDLGILNIANTMPQILAPLVAVTVVPGLGYRALFVLAIVFAAAGGLCLLPIRRVR